MKDQIVELLKTEWNSIAELCSDLTDAEWERSTDCPGWTVRDQVSHVIAIERTLMGEPEPQGFEEAKLAEHVKNPVGELNEAWAASRRPLSGAEVLKEMVDVTNQRLAIIEKMTEEEMDKVGWSPIGEVPFSVSMSVRAFDCWVHEQDIRRAIGRPGHMTGVAAENAIDRIVMALPFVVGKRSGALDGQSVYFRVTGPTTRDVVVVMEDGKGRDASADPILGTAKATSTLSMDTETLVCLGCGRWDPEQAIFQAKVAIEGDVELGQKVVHNLNFMF